MELRLAINSREKRWKKSGKLNALLHRQGFVMSETLKRSTYWEFVQLPHHSFIPFENQLVGCKIIWQKKTSILLELKPQSTFLELVETLNQTKLCKKKIHANNFSKLIRGERRVYYNCQFLGIALSTRKKQKNIR